MTLGGDTATTKDTLIGYVRYLTNTASNTGTIGATDIKAALNQEQRKLQALILSEVGMVFKENATPGTGSGLVNLVSGTNNYDFPSSLLTIDRVEINYTGGTNTWVAAEPLKQESITQAISNISNNNAIRGSKAKPIYWVYNDDVWVDPVPDAAVTGGLKIFYTTQVTDLSSSGDSPIFIEFTHPIIALGAAIEWLNSKDHTGKMGYYIQDKAVLEQRAVQFYANRDQDVRKSLNVRVKNYR